MDNFSDEVSIWRGNIFEIRCFGHTKDNPTKRWKNDHAETVPKN